MSPAKQASSISSISSIGSTSSKQDMNAYPHLLHSPHNKRRSLQKSKKSKPGKNSPEKNSPEKVRRSQPDLKDVDLKSRKYYTSPDEDTLTKASPRYQKEAGVLKSEATVLREAHVNLMIKQKEQASAWERAKEEKMRDVEKAKEERTDSLEKRLGNKIHDSDKYQALLKATEYERDRLKDILFEQTTSPTIDTSTVTRQGAVYKEFLSPHDIPSPRTARKRLELRGEEVENLSPLPSPRGDVVTINNLTSIVSDGSEVENVTPRGGERKSWQEKRKRDVSCASTQSGSPYRRDMSSSYKEEDFSQLNRSSRSPDRRSPRPLEDKSINTSLREEPVLKPCLSPSPKPDRRTSTPVTVTSHHLDTFDTISEDFLDDVTRSDKKVSFIEDDKDIVIKRLSGEVETRERELKDLRYNTTALKRKLSESESNKLMMESEALRLSLQTITGPKASAEKPPPHSQTTSSRQNVSQSNASAFSDITEVNSMLHAMKSENESLKAALNQATMKAQHSTQLLEERLTAVTKERDNFAEENRRFQRLVASDDRGSRIALLQRDLQTSIAENEKLRVHLQKLRETYAKFFGGSI